MGIVDAFVCERCEKLVLLHIIGDEEGGRKEV